MAKHPIQGGRGGWGGNRKYSWSPPATEIAAVAGHCGCKDLPRLTKVLQ